MCQLRKVERKRDVSVYEPKTTDIGAFMAVFI